MPEKNFTALIIDDEAAPRNILLNYIPWSELGFSRVETAVDGKDGWEKALDIKPDLIISDVRMPHINGTELCGMIRETFPSCAFIFISGFSDKNYLKSAITYNAVEYIEKPIDLPKITGIISDQAHLIEEKRKYYIQKKISESSEKTNNLLKNLDGGVYAYVKSYSQKKIHRLYSIYQNNKMNILDEKMEGIFRASNTLCNYTKIDESMHVLETFDTEEDSVFLKLIKEDNFPLEDVFIVKGRPCTHIDQIYLSFEENIKLKNLLFYRGWGYQVGYDSFNPKKIPLTPDYNEFSKLIVSDINEAEKIIDSYYKNAKKSETENVDQVREMMIQFILILQMNHTQYNLDRDSYIYPITITKISQTPLLKEIKDLISAAVVYFKSKWNEKTDFSSMNTGEKIIKLIEENFKNPLLDTKMLAQELSLAPNYLCTIVKKDTEHTISQLLTNCRIKEAMKLLQETNLTIGKIANTVGYQDGKYFSKVFEKETGMKAKLFRERNQKQGLCPATEKD